MNQYRGMTKDDIIGKILEAFGLPTYDPNVYNALAEAFRAGFLTGEEYAD